MRTRARSLAVVDHSSTAFFFTYLTGSDRTATLAADDVGEFGDVSLSRFDHG